MSLKKVDKLLRSLTEQDDDAEDAARETYKGHEIKVIPREHGLKNVLYIDGEKKEAGFFSIAAAKAYGETLIDNPDISVDEQRFSRQVFRQVADILKAHSNTEVGKEIARDFAVMFAADNPQFDKDRFFRAAGINPATMEGDAPKTQQPLKEGLGRPSDALLGHILDGLFADNGEKYDAALINVLSLWFGFTPTGMVLSAPDEEIEKVRQKLSNWSGGLKSIGGFGTAEKKKAVDALLNYLEKEVGRRGPEKA